MKQSHTLEIYLKEGNLSVYELKLKHLVSWLNANKISLNAKDTEMVIFKSERCYPTESVKYLEVKICTNLRWQCQVNDVLIKLNRANTLLFKIICVSPKILRYILFAIFKFHLPYCSPVRTQNFRTFQGIVILQKKAVRIIKFQPWNFHTSPLSKQSSILKFQDKISLENIKSFFTFYS